MIATEIQIETIEKNVIGVLAEKCCVEEENIHLDTSLVDDLSMDSLDAVEAAFQFEETYHLEIPDEDIRNFKTVQDIVNYLHEKLK